MKQNAKRKSFIIVVAMLVLLATVLGMSGMTFAKYISSESIPAESATVAQWGWIIDTKAGNLFSETYGDTVTDNLVSVNTNGGTTVVKAYDATNANVVAPGTTGSLEFTITGSAEVATAIIIAVDDNLTEVTLTDDADKTYAPIKWTLYEKVDPVTNNNNPWKVYNEAQNLDLAGITAKLEGMSVDYIAAGGSYAHDGEYKLVWEWAFNNETANVVGTLTGNEADTMLGAYAANSTANALPTDWEANLTVSFGMSITVTQVQKDPTP